MSDREADIVEFLRTAGWESAKRMPLAGDASTRRYERLVQNNTRLVLMDAPPAAETPACPAGASDEQRCALGYNAIACLAGPDSGPFAAMSDWLVELGLSAPRIMHADLNRGLLLLEDLGDDLFADVISRGASADRLYTAALDVLDIVHSAGTPSALPVRGRPDFELKSYDALALQAEADLLIEWYWPLILGAPPDDAVRDSYNAAWSPMIREMGEDRTCIVLRDFHAQNLLWLPDREATARVGLIDFQDAVIGSTAYDLVSLLEDARRDVSPDLAGRMLDYYIALQKSRDPGFDDGAFRRAYALFGAQRNAKIVGIFARLSVRDRKPDYLKLLPRVWRYLTHDLEHPSLAELKKWFDEYINVETRQSVPEIRK